MKKLLLVLFLLGFLGFCKIHLGEGQVNFWVQTTPPPFSADYARVNIVKISLHFVGHSDVDLNVDPVEVDFSPGAGAQMVGTFLLNTGSYDRLTLEFGGALLSMGGLEYEVDMKEGRVTLPVKLEVTRDTPRTLRIFMEGSSFAYQGGGKFTFSPVISVSVE